MRMTQRSDSWFANIWIAGDAAMARQACARYCTEIGLCVTVTPTTFVYTGGAEEGVCVRLINYPRFPEPVEERMAKAAALAELLVEALCQKSYSIEYPDETIWRTRAVGRELGA
jgi:hypothetical protein